MRNRVKPVSYYLKLYREYAVLFGQEIDLGASRLERQRMIASGVVLDNMIKAGFFKEPKDALQRFLHGGNMFRVKNRKVQIHVWGMLLVPLANSAPIELLTAATVFFDIKSAFILIKKELRIARWYFGKDWLKLDDFMTLQGIERSLLIIGCKNFKRFRKMYKHLPFLNKAALIRGFHKIVKPSMWYKFFLRYRLLIASNIGNFKNMELLISMQEVEDFMLKFPRLDLDSVGFGSKPRKYKDRIRMLKVCEILLAMLTAANRKYTCSIAVSANVALEAILTEKNVMIRSPYIQLEKDLVIRKPSGIGPSTFGPIPDDVLGRPLYEDKENLKELFDGMMKDKKYK